MTTPLRADCRSPDAIPSVDILRQLVTNEQHLVLQFPPAALATPAGAKASLVQRLASLLPDCTVFDSGSHDGCECVTLARVVSAEEVRANTAAFVHALRLFRRTATDLVTRLAAQLGVEPDHLLAELRNGPNGTEKLGLDWDYYQHGGGVGSRTKTAGRWWKSGLCSPASSAYSTRTSLGSS